MGGRERFKAGDTEAHDQYPGRPNRASSGRYFRQHASQMGRAELYGIVSRQRRLAGKGIHRLCTGDARDSFHGETRDLLLEQALTSAGSLFA